MDLEMTGLNEKTDHILEIAALITDKNLNEIDRYEAVIFQPQQVLDQMNDWCKEHHGKSGLTAKVPTGKTIITVQSELLAFIKKHFGEKKGKDGAVLAGNSIHNDRRFIDVHLPQFAGQLHYRMVDVSSFKEIFRENYGIKFEKKNTHRAVEDILESIAELKHYLSFVKTN